MLAVTYFLPQPDLRLLYALMTLAAVVVMFPVLVAIMPMVVGCCAVVLPVIGKLVFGAVIVAVFGWATYPKAGK